MFKKITISALLAMASTLAVKKTMAQKNDPLQFPKDKFTVETKTVKTSAGDKKVTYKSYMHVLYVANPVDKDYQSMNVSVPIKVDDVDVDATNAPILFVVGVGGYMSVNNAKGGGMGGGRDMGGPPPGGGFAGGGMPPIGANGPGGPGGMPPMGMGGPGGNSKTSGKADLALAAGYVVVLPGCRGRDNQAADGTYFGKAPAAIVDLKAAVRYIKHNQGVLPGNTNWIISTGVSAGGALSALLGASGNSALYDTYLKEIGAANEKDNIYACAAFCPITDLDHADGAYEWMYGASPLKTGLVDQDVSKQLKASFVQYQASLNLQGKNDFGTITADNYGQYLLKYYTIPAANKYLNNLDDEKRAAYLASNKWIAWDGKAATFSFADYVAHVGRMKGLPAFDDFNLTSGETSELGDKTTNAKHFTNFSLRHATGNNNAEVSDDEKQLVNMMNAMYFITQKKGDIANYWWLRKGTSDPHTSQTVIINLATSLENQHKQVNTSLYWDAGHGADEDPEDLIAWVGKITNVATGQ